MQKGGSLGAALFRGARLHSASEVHVRTRA